MQENSSSFTLLQTLLKQSYSENPDDQQKAAIELSKLVEGTVFPAVSFGPIAHAICRLIISKNRTVVSYASKTLKFLILDDALRPQILVAGVPAIVMSSLTQWNTEVLCIKELLGVLQTLTWDKQCLLSVLQTDTVAQIIKYINHQDQEVSVLALATLANILSYVDTLLLTNTVLLEVLGTAISILIESLRLSQSQRPQRFYAASCIANASCHPRLANILIQSGGLQLCRELERQQFTNIQLIGSRMSDCANTALYQLSQGKEGDSTFSKTKYRFKYGTKSVMEISLVPYHKYAGTLSCCFIVWLIMIVFIFSPLIRYKS